MSRRHRLVRLEQKRPKLRTIQACASAAEAEYLPATDRPGAAQGWGNGEATWRQSGAGAHHPEGNAGTEPR